MKKLFLCFLLSSFCFSARSADISITAASVVPSSQARTARFPAGVALTAGQLVYLEAATNTLKLADANGAAALTVVRGIAVNNTAAGQTAEIVTYDPELTIGATVAIGDVLVCSATAGGIAPVADLATGWYATVVGVAISTTKICFGTTMRAAAAK